MALRPSMVPTPFLLIVASSVVMLVSSKIVESEMTKISPIKIPQLPSNQWSDEKMFDMPGLQQCWASFSSIGGCIDELNLILRDLKSGGGEATTGLMGPTCCDVVKVMHEHCWPQMLPDPLFIKINFFCSHRHHRHSVPKIPTPYGPPPMAPQAPAPAPMPQNPSPAPAPQDPPQSPEPPQYSYPTPPGPQFPSPNPPGPQDPIPSPATPQLPSPTPPAPQDPLPSPTTPQYPLPTPPGPPCSCCHGPQP